MFKTDDLNAPRPGESLLAAAERKFDAEREECTKAGAPRGALTRESVRSTADAATSHADAKPSTTLDEAKARAAAEIAAAGVGGAPAGSLQRR